ncbi:D-alanyl-D-alanine carboxypeptidase [Lentibacillus cibarius]|uniref:D-alanyl-D-alanine carboxypeptidase n=1 Tax=Lentibacillus cibarius TaxID=2583219 RepID=A0A549YL54_9BACI|nr:D-alanyl-D-alanine carboxypeptidase family protein [Lentibacillus cibarius]TRM12611.1 D-alanyl-D-alanine carboxypeptidase [Lentibacillus cibarius]
MRGYAVLMIVFFLVSTLISPSVGQAKPGVSADNAVLMEQSSGRVLYDKQAHEQRSIASITKIMTAIIAIESGKLDETVTVSNRAVHAIGSSIYLEKGEKIKLKDLVYGLMLRSGNDAAVAISEYVGGSVEGFVHLMNKKASWIGMTNSSFANPHGLDADNHYSTAYDMALLMRYAMDNNVFRQVTQTKIYKSDDQKYVWRNKHKLLTSRYQYTIGGKTGYTSTAGRTLVTAAKKEDMELIAVTLNASADWNDHIGMFEWGFDNYDMTTIAEKGLSRYNIESTDNQVTGYLQQNVNVPLKKDEQLQIDKKSFILEGSQRSGKDVIGKTVFFSGSVPIAETPIYAKREGKTDFLDHVVSIYRQIARVDING